MLNIPCVSDSFKVPVFAELARAVCGRPKKIISFARALTVTFPVGRGRPVHLAGPIIRERLLNASLGIFIWLTF